MSPGPYSRGGHPDAASDGAAHIVHIFEAQRPGLQLMRRALKQCHGTRRVPILAQTARHELSFPLRRRWGTARSGASEESYFSRLCRSSELRRTAASARHMELHVPPCCAADVQEWQEMGQEHLFARAEQSVCSAPYAVVSQVLRDLFNIGDHFFIVVSRCAAALPSPVRPHRTMLASCPRADPTHCFALSGVSAVATAAWQRGSAACAAVRTRACGERQRGPAGRGWSSSKQVQPPTPSRPLLPQSLAVESRSDGVRAL